VDAGVYVYHRQIVSTNTIKPFLENIFGNFKIEEECEYAVARIYWQSSVSAIKQAAAEVAVA
jgi:hypothetical protein